MTITTKRPYTLRDVREGGVEDLYVEVRASKLLGKNSTLVIPHTPRDAQTTTSIELPMTTNPINMAEYAPVEEILRNSEFLRQLSRGTLKLMSPEDAEAILETPEGRAETERLQADKIRQFTASTLDPHSENYRVVQEQMKAQVPPELMAGLNASPGQVDPALIGITPEIAGIMSEPDVPDSIRAARLRNIANIKTLTERDKAFIRNRSVDPDIRKIVS